MMRLYIVAVFFFVTTVIASVGWVTQAQRQHDEQHMERKAIKMLDAFDKGKIAINDSNFIYAAHLIGLPQPEISLMLAKHESGNWTSFIFTENNNMFGIKYFPGARHMITDSNRFGYVRHTHWIESLVQLKRYYECAGTHLYGYSASDNYWNENWQRWISYTRTPGFPFGVDEKNKIIRK